MDWAVGLGEKRKATDTTVEDRYVQLHTNGDIIELQLLMDNWPGGMSDKTKQQVKVSKT